MTDVPEQLNCFAMGVAYNGARFGGWQRQKHDPETIQGKLEASLSKVANQSVEVHCAGRTDAKVHAIGQVFHIQTGVERPLHAWIDGGNTYLPDEIAIKWIKAVDSKFHARYSAVARSYSYYIYNQPRRQALGGDRFTWIYKPLNADLMHEAAQSLVGEHDFSAFRGAGCQSNSPFRDLHSISVTRQSEFVRVDVKANAFLLHMVRNIVGSLIEVGSEDKPVKWIHELLLSQDRTLAGVTAPPNGLYFVNAHYEAPYEFPEAKLTHMSVPVG